MCVCLCVCERESVCVCVLAVTHTICSIDDLHKPYFYYTWGHFFSHGTPVWPWTVITGPRPRTVGHNYTIEIMWVTTQTQLFLTPPPKIET